jgi:hypothetical protein
MYSVIDFGNLAVCLKILAILDPILDDKLVKFYKKEPTWVYSKKKAKNNLI